MADSSTDDVGTNTQTRNLLLKRNPHLRVNDTSSPGFGGLGTRQFLQKQLMTPGSATSASSFEEAASYDGFSDAGTPSETLAIKSDVQQSLNIKTSTFKQPTKRLSSPSRESLARRFLSEDNNTVDMVEGESDLPPSALLSNIVVKSIPSISIGDSTSMTSMVPLSPRSTKVTRRIVASPRKTLRRVVIRRTDADGKVHEEVQYVDADGQTVQGGNFFNTEGQETTATRVSTPAKPVRRVVVRKTGEDGQVHEQVQFLDADGNVVETQNVNSTPSRSTVTRIVTPGKLTRRILRRTGVDGQVFQEVQYLDVDGNVVKTEGDNASIDNVSSSSGTVVTRTGAPGKTIRRVIVRSTGADGQMQEEVQFVDADGNVVQKDGNLVLKTSNFNEDSALVSGDIMEETSTNEESSDTGRKKVTHRVIRRMVQKDGTSVPVEQYVDSGGNVIEQDGALVSTGSFTGSIDTSGSSSRRVTRRVVATPVRRTVVHKTGSSSGAESEEDVQYVESDGDDLARSGSFTRTVNTYSGSGRRVITRRVVTPQRVVRRMIVHKGTGGSSAEEDLDIDAEFVSSDESVDGSSRGGSSRGGYIVSDRIMIPGSETRRVVSRSVVSSNQQEEVNNVATSTVSTIVDESTSTNDEVKVIAPVEVAVTSVDRDDEDKRSIDVSEAAGLEESTPKHAGRSSHNDEVILAVAAVGGGAAMINATAYHNKVVAPVSNELNIEPKEDNTKDANVYVAPTASSPVVETVKTVVESSDVALDSVPEVSESPREDVVLPAEANTTAVLVDNSATRVPEDEEANGVISPDGPVVPTTETEKVKEESNAGFWGLFSKSEPKDSQTSDVDRDATASLTTPVSEALASPSIVTKTSPTSREIELENPSTGILNEIPASGVADEEKSLIPSAEEPHMATTTVTSTLSSPKSPRDNKILQTAALAGVTTAAAVHALDNKESDDHTAAHAPKTNSVEEEVAEPINVPAPSDPHAIVTTTQNTEEEFESPSKVPHRKTGGSIWKFWSGDKPKSPRNEDEKPKDEEKRAVSSLAAPVAVTSETNEEQTSAHDIHHWQQQDKQHPTQISFATAEDATNGPESKFEPMPATDKTRSPVARGQGAVVESPRVSSASPRENMVTEIPQTTVEVEKFDTSSIYHDAAETGPDIAVATKSQQVVECESVEREEPKDVKPARAGGFWGFLGNKESTPAITTGGSNAKRVSWTIEGDAGKPCDSTKDEEDATVVASVLQVESVRRSIPSDGTPSDVAGPEASNGKLVRDSERRTTELIDGVEPDIELDEHYIEVASPRHGGRALANEGQWSVKPCSLAWSNVRLDRNNWKNAPVGTQAGNNDVVLDDVSGSVKAGEFLVITGPSKDESLAMLSCLAGYEDAMEGNVTVNGREWNEKMNRYIAYVMREDLFYETLTVHEHLVMQAQLRMRRTHSDEMCLERVESVIKDMGLDDCRDKFIGGGISLRGITRRERKLLALATALLTNPSILLVEEPTDRLDTFSAEKIVAKLRWLAFEKGLTIVVTLHHPSSHFYGLFDVLYLVADGSCVYDGKAADCVAYFSTIGYQCPEYMSPMDYFMLQMVVGDRDSDDEGVARVETLKREWTERNASVYAENAARAAATSEDAVVDDYEQNNRYYHMGCCGQLWLLWARHVRRLSRYGFVFWWHLLAALLIGVVFGLVYLQLDLDDQHGIQNFSGSFFYIVVVQMLFIAYRTFVFIPRETTIALRERQEYRGGWYHLLCWYFTKIIAELPALIILSIVLFVPVFLLVGIGHGFKVYIYMQIVMVLAGWAAIAWAFLTLGILRHVTLALIVYAVLLVLFVAFGGLLINVTDIPDWLVWLHYTSPVKYAYEAMMKIFWKRVDSIDCDWTLEGCVALTGDGVLKYYSMENRSALGDSLILLGICVAVFVVAFWFLLVLANKRISGLQWRYDWTFKGPLGRMQQRVMNATVNEKHAATRSSTQRVLERKSHHSSSAAVERNSVVEGDNFYIRVETPRTGSHGMCDAPSITLGWGSLWLKAQTDKVSDNQQYLLSDASGSAKCGELMLITGPSDESNVALLESLGGLQKSLKGKVTLNGVVSAAPKVSKCSVYVARDDLFYETLTVEEHLRFQAQLIVGNSSRGCGLCCGSANDLETERVKMVLDELELTSKRHMLIRYLSAADTKLLAIATTLLTNPSILLTEEPTCGMNFYSSQRVVLKLRQLARGGRTVVVTMGHPSSHLYALFDSLYLLAGGAAVYHGKVREAVPYFASLGYQCPQYMSPVDYFIRQVSVRGKDNQTVDDQRTLFTEAWATRTSELCLDDNIEEQEEQGGVATSRRRIGCCGQFSLLFRRHILRLARYRAVFGWHAFWMIVLGVIFGLIFLQLDLDDQQDIQNWAGAFFYIIVLQILVIAYRTFVFLPREMVIAEREHRFGGYYMVCWYLTKVFAELPAMLVLSTLLFVPAYLLIGIGHGFKLYFYMQIVMWLSGWSAAGMASLLLGLFRRVRVALIVYMLLLLLFVIFGGLLINVDDVPDYLIWLHYISPVKYGYEAMMKLFWGRIGFLACGGSDGSESGSTIFATVGDATVGDDYSFSMAGSGSYEDDDGCIAHSGDEVLEHYSMENSRDARSDSIILLELTVLYFFIGYAILSLRWRRYKTHQQRHSATNNVTRN